MKYLLKFFRLPCQKRQVLCQAALLLPVCQLCARFLPLAILLKLFRLKTTHDPEWCSSPPLKVDDILLVEWAVTTAARYIPFLQTFCLAQALTTRTLLRWRAIDCVLNLGISKSDNRSLTAHAWLNCNGIIIKCGSDINMFTNITAFY